MQTERERLEVEKVIHDSIGWALTKDTDYAIKDLRLKFAELGNAAWYSCMLDDHAEWNGQPTGWDNARWTGGSKSGTVNG